MGLQSGECSQVFLWSLFSLRNYCQWAGPRTRVELRGACDHPHFSSCRRVGVSTAAGPHKPGGCRPTPTRECLHHLDGGVPDATLRSALHPATENDQASGQRSERRCMLSVNEQASSTCPPGFRGHRSACCSGGQLGQVERMNHAHPGPRTASHCGGVEMGEGGSRTSPRRQGLSRPWKHT